MPEMDPCDVSIVPVGTPRRPALTLALGHLPVAERRAMVAALLDDVATRSDTLRFLLAAWRNDELVGAILAQLRSPRLAHVWPPQTVDPADATLRLALVQAIVERLAAAGVVEAQTLLDTDAGPMAECFRGAGFSHLADLLYLVCVSSEFPSGPPAGPVEFVPYQPADEQRFADLIAATYEATLDCPDWRPAGTALDVLRGYRDDVAAEHRHWFDVRVAGKTIGCLLLADHPQPDHLELVYMGLLPGERGHGYGIAMVRQAQWVAAQLRRARVVLAVDADNQPALEIYAIAGFVGWDRRSVFSRCLANTLND